MQNRKVGGFMEDRKITLLKACRDLLRKQHETAYVVNILDTAVNYDNAERDGSRLLDDIESLLIKIEK